MLNSLYNVHLKSFTLIEVLISIALSAILITTGALTYRGAVEVKKMTSEAQKMVSILELAQKKSRSSDQSLGCAGNFLGYRVILSSTSYMLVARCSGGSTTAQTYPFPPSISAAFNQTIDFAQLTGQTTPACMRLRSTKSTECRCIVTQSSGLISEARCSSCGACP